MASQDYIDVKEQYVQNSVSLQECEMDVCEKDGVNYKLFFNGEIEQDDIVSEKWSEE